jgi:hypothetical protein
LTLAVTLLVIASRHAWDYAHDETVVDFIAIYSGAHVQTYDYEAQKDHQRQVLLDHDKVARTLKFPYPPHLFFLVRPLALFAFIPAHVIWSGAQLLLMALGFWLVNGQRLDGWLVFAASMSVHQALLHGQYMGLIFLGLALFLYGQARKRPVLTALGLALLTLKPQFAVFPWLWTLARREWRSFSIAAGVTGLSLLLAFAWIGFSEIELFVELTRSAAGNARLYDLQDALGNAWFYYGLIALGCVYTVRAADVRRVTLVSILLAPGLHTHDLTLFLVLLPALGAHRGAHVLAALIPAAGVLLSSAVAPVITLYAGLGGILLLVRGRETRIVTNVPIVKPEEGTAPPAANQDDNRGPV